jgi:hypothetical protein
LWKRLKGPYNLRSAALAALVLSVAGGCLGLIARGAWWLRTPVRAGSDGPPAGAPVPPGESASALQIGEQILSRNIFDSVGGPQPWELPGAHPEQSDGGTVDDAGVVLTGARCSGDLRLLASVVRARDPSLSLAAVRKDGKTHIVTIGERLGELELIAVHPTGAYFRDGARGACSLPVYLSTNEAPLPPPPPPEPEPVKQAPAQVTVADAETRAKRPPAFSEEELKRNIRVLGPSRYAVTRELFSRARMNPAGISRGARFKPQTREGRSSGMQVFKLRDDSLLAHLGVRQGDVLRGINGFSLASADGVMEAFGHLGKKSEVALSIERDGAMTTIQYVLE